MSPTRPQGTAQAPSGPRRVVRRPHPAPLGSGATPLFSKGPRRGLVPGRPGLSASCQEVTSAGGPGGPIWRIRLSSAPPPHFLVLEFAYRESSPEQSCSSDLAVDEGLLVPQTRRLLDVVPGTAWVCLSGSGFPVPQT